jgi:hypothetical protein
MMGPQYRKQPLPLFEYVETTEDSVIIARMVLAVMRAYDIIQQEDGKAQPVPV